MIVARRVFAVKREGRFRLRVVTVEVPISAVDRRLFFGLRFAHVDAVVDARRVADNKRRSVVSLGFFQRFYELRFVCAHGALRHVNIAVGCGDHAQILLFHAFARRCELRNRADRGGLRCLSARVGINFGVEHKHVHVFAACEHVVESAVTDVVRPAVAADDPERFFNEAVFIGIDFFFERVAFAAAVFAFFDARDQLFRGNFARFGVVHACDPGFARRFAFRPFFPQVGKLCDLVFQRRSSCLVSEVHAVTEFGVILEEGVRPSRSVTLFVGRIRAGGGRTAVNRRAARCVCNDHSVAEELRDHFYVRRFAAACARARELEQRRREL